MLIVTFRYPLYQRGNPQLRVFLPNFWVKILKPEKKLPSNVVKFGCSMEMTNHDIKNYLTKIYDIPIVRMRVFIEQGDQLFTILKNHMSNVSIISIL